MIKAGDKVKCIDNFHHSGNPYVYLSLNKEYIVHDIFDKDFLVIFHDDTLTSGQYGFPNGTGLYSKEKFILMINQNKEIDYLQIAKDVCGVKE